MSVRDNPFTLHSFSLETLRPREIKGTGKQKWAGFWELVLPGLKPVGRK